MFWGWAESTYVGLTLKPAWLSVAVASPIVFPTTPGTVTGVGPLETLIRTFVPETTCVPTFGSDAVTSSAGVVDWTSCTSGTRCTAFSALIASSDFRPFSVGTATFGLPVDTKMVTSFPFDCLWPAGGSCWYTKLFGAVRLGWCFTTGWKPSA